MVQSAQQAAEHVAKQESALAEAAWLSQTIIPSQTARNQIATIAIGLMYDFGELCVAIRYVLKEDRVKLMFGTSKLTGKCKPSSKNQRRTLAHHLNSLIFARVAATSKGKILLPYKDML